MPLHLWYQEVAKSCSVTEEFPLLLPDFGTPSQKKAH